MLQRRVPLLGALLALVLAAGIALPGCAMASGSGRTLEVGPTHLLKLPSQASLVAADGDTVLIDPGVYKDCAIWHANRLTIAARGPGVVFDGKSCKGMGIFVIYGDAVTVRGITFKHAAVPDRNGSGIREVGGDLTVEDCKFIDNEEGILSWTAPAATIRVIGSEFRGNGICAEACAHAIYAGQIGLLVVENSRFTDTHVGHDIKSRAARTILRGNDISDGPTGHSSYLIDLPNGGDLLMEGNTLSKGPHTDNARTAVEIGEEHGRNPTTSLVIRDNTFTNMLGRPTAFVTNTTDTPVALIGNKLIGPVVPVVGPGMVH